MRDAFLFQPVKEPTRGRLENVPNILDIVLTNEDFAVAESSLLKPFWQERPLAITVSVCIYIHERVLKNKEVHV